MVSFSLTRSLIGAGALLLTVTSLFAQGAIKATTTLHPDGTQTTTVFDPEKRTAEETTQTTQGKVIRKVTYLLDDQNQPLGSITADGKGTVLYRSSYRRDGAGRIEEESVTSNDGQPLRRRVYTYGANNKVARMDEYDANGNLLVPARKQGRGVPDKEKKRR